MEQGEWTMSALNLERCNERSIVRLEEDQEREVGLRIIERLARDAAAPELESISLALRQVLRHKFFACALLRVYDGCILRVVNLDFPKDWLDEFRIRAGTDACPLVRQWLSMHVPIIIPRETQEAVQGPGHAVRAWPASGNLAVHAQLDSTGTRGLMFCFGCVIISEKLDELLRFITPFLFSALAKVFWAPTKSVDCRTLTSREIEVIEWMYCGKTNEEIAGLLNISVYTVKNHVQKILLKLSATNRTQAVLRAVDAGIIRNPEYIRQHHSTSS
jgi:LuxR family transcriptional regulator, quorum-sensing system regulator SolR